MQIQRLRCDQIFLLNGLNILIIIFVQKTKKILLLIDNARSHFNLKRFEKNNDDNDDIDDDIEISESDSEQVFRK